MNGGTPFFMPGNQAPGGYAQANNRPAVPARAGGIPVLPTGVARGIRSDEPARAVVPPSQVRAVAMAIPSPRDLGLVSASAAPVAAPAAPVALDWAATRRQLDEVGAVRFEMEKLTSGGSRFSCWVREGSSLRPVTGEAGSEGDAVRLCLARARQARP